MLRDKWDRLASKVQCVGALAKESDDKFKFIIFSDDSELPYLIRGGYYKNVARMRWNVNEEDKVLLTQRVQIAIDKLCTDVKISA